MGNTEVVARKIRDLIGCDVYRIEPTDPYPESYDATEQASIRRGARRRWCRELRRCAIGG
ncbi:hypothetical protein ACFVYE_04745 [Streptomyces sp. NPDC058239]|uniref:hypothetical protein n=1 Tax=unclassified Streptomyces TaxID=2593676 RepID=UPI00365D183A